MYDDRPTPQLTADVWLRGFADRYLQDYVPSGGSVIRFVSGTDPALALVQSGLQSLAAEGNYHYCLLDANRRTAEDKPPNLHSIERFYAAVTEHVDWLEWAEEQARKVLSELGLDLPDGVDLGDLEAIAEANRTDPKHITNRVEWAMRDERRDRSTTIEYHSATTNLWVDWLLPDKAIPGRRKVLSAWLSGETPPTGGASVLKRYQIYGKIGPANGRHFLASFCEWLRQVGRSGLLVTLDFRAYERSGRRRSPSETALASLRSAHKNGADFDELYRLLELAKSDDGGLGYGKRPYEQMLSLLRRFIDEIDRFRSFALVVLMSPQYFAPNDPHERRYTDYSALSTRIGDEVSDRHRANPDAALVRLGEGQR